MFLHDLRARHMCEDCQARGETRGPSSSGGEVLSGFPSQGVSSRPCVLPPISIRMAPARTQLGDLNTTVASNKCVSLLREDRRIGSPRVTANRRCEMKQGGATVQRCTVSDPRHLRTEETVPILA